MARTIVHIFEAIALLGAMGGGWLILSTLTQPDLMAPALAASAATALCLAAIPYFVARILASALLNR